MIEYKRIRSLAGAAVVGLLAAAGCSTPVPTQVHDICAVFRQRADWYQAALDSARRWGTPVPVMMAIIRHESGFRADARPPRRRLLWLFPGSRPSTAYGYPQALDSTWASYQAAIGSRWAERDDFADAVDFVGWYNDRSARINAIDKSDTYNLYLAYYSGHQGYKRGSYRGQSWVLKTAARVSKTAQRYREQLRTCSAGSGS